MTVLLTEWPDHDVQHHDAWTCVECGDTGTGGAVGYARHHHEHHDPAPTPTGEHQ